MIHTGISKTSFQNIYFRKGDKKFNGPSLQFKSGNTSWFWPRVRARALRAPVFLSSLPPPNGALRAPLPARRSFAASYLTPKNT
jgi:hypothetical protein